MAQNWVPNNLIYLPSQFIYNDANNNPVYQLYPYDYLVLLGQNTNLISIALSGETHTNIIQAQQISALQTAVATIPSQYYTPQISGQCLNSNVTQGIDVILGLMVTAWCNFVAVIGSNSNLNIAIATQCANLNSAPSFSHPGASMSALPGWKTSPVTVADTLTNNWLTTCDARVGISNALAAVTPTCNQVVINYQVVLTGGNSIFAFYFNSYTYIPSGYVDNGSTILIQDTAGNHYQQSFNIVNVSNSSGPYSIPLSGTTLQSNSNYTITVNSNVTNSTLGLTCQKTMVEYVNAQTTQTNIGCCPDIGTFSLVTTSGQTINTSYNLITSLTYTPRYVSLIPKTFYTVNNSAANFLPKNIYITYTQGGAVLNLTTGSGPVTDAGGTIQYDWMAFK